MSKKPKPKRNTNDVETLLTDMLIVQLAAAGVQKEAIRQIVGCDSNRVSRIAKHIRAARKTAATKGQRSN
jgi:hypothetical protein